MAVRASGKANMDRHSRLAAASVALFAIGMTSVFFIDLCNLIYNCGCDHLWAGFAAKCNIHDPNSRHCPWCSVGDTGATALYLGIVIPQAMLGFRPARWSWKRRLAAALAAFPLIGAAEGIALGMAMGYWN